jgi:hypothetical protein
LPQRGHSALITASAGVALLAVSVMAHRIRPRVARDNANAQQHDVPLARERGATWPLCAN